MILFNYNRSLSGIDYYGADIGGFNRDFNMIIEEILAQFDAYFALGVKSCWLSRRWMWCMFTRSPISIEALICTIRILLMIL
jgi:hypothetical protein